MRPVESSWVTAPLITDASGKAAVKVALYRNSIFISNGDNWVYICDQEVPNNYYRERQLVLHQGSAEHIYEPI